MTEVKETSEQIAARVRETLPDYLKQSPEEIEADKTAMRLKAASFTRSKLTDAERVIVHGAKLEEIASANIDTQESLRAEGRNVSTNGGANLEMLKQEKIRLAHGLELQGRYSEAAEAHPHKREQKRLREIEEAIAKDDSDICDCPPEKAELNGQAIEVHPHYEVKKIYSRRHGKMVSLVGCRKCQSLNATPTIPAQLQKILAASDPRMADAHLLKVN